jgi:hypothetical protein
MLDLGTARTTPLPDRKALDMILEKLQKFVAHIFRSMQNGGIYFFEF